MCSFVPIVMVSGRSVCLVCLVYLGEPDQLDELNKPDRPDEPQTKRFASPHVGQRLGRTHGGSSTKLGWLCRQRNFTAASFRLHNESAMIFR